MQEIDTGYNEARKVVIKQTVWGTFAQYIPPKPSGILVLGHCYPWPDGSRTTSQLAEHAKHYADRWRTFADDHHLIELVPAFGSGDFTGYRDLFGAQLDADAFVNSLVDQYGRKFIDSFDGKFYLYGHSAGGQFANRYTVVHPHRLIAVVLSAPGRYAYPDPSIPWPYGMGAIHRKTQDDRRWPVGERPRHFIETKYQPEALGWEIAATSVPIAIIIGAEDKSLCQPQPGHEPGTRIDYAKKWMKMMNGLAEQNGIFGTVSLTIVEGIAHDPIGLTAKAQELFHLA